MDLRPCSRRSFVIVKLFLKYFSFREYYLLLENYLTIMITHYPLNKCSPHARKIRCAGISPYPISYVKQTLGNCIRFRRSDALRDKLKITETEKRLL